MPTTPSTKCLESSEKLSPASQLAQLEREQKLRQEEQNKLLKFDMVGKDNSENSEGDDSKIDSNIRVIYTFCMKSVFYLYFSLN